MVTFLCLMTGCATPTLSDTAPPVLFRRPGFLSPHALSVAPASKSGDTRQTPESIPVLRQGRYTLEELTPTAQQRDLFLQVVEVSLPDQARATVGDGLRHLLKRSGYQLCAPVPATAGLYALPLPAAHRHLGPTTLREALLTLAGPAWALKVDEPMRQVCFVRPDAAPGNSPADAPAESGTPQPRPVTSESRHE